MIKFFLDIFDYFETYGVIKAQKLYLTFEECFFMLQNYMIKLDNKERKECKENKNKIDNKEFISKDKEGSSIYKNIKI